MAEDGRVPGPPNSSPACDHAGKAPARLTIRDVAQAAGVSTATVSRALRGLSVVEPRTREHIVAVARQLNYAVSPAASRLATGRTGTIGIVTPFVGRWYFTEVFAGIDERLRAHDVELLIHTTGAMTDPGLPSAAERMRRRVDGALIIGMSPSPADFEGLIAVDVPVVLLGAQFRGLPSVSIDDYGGARRAVQHLVDGGHRRIGLLSGRNLPTTILPENARLRGYLEVLAEHDLPAPPQLRSVGHFTSAGGFVAMQRLLNSDDPPTAVFAMSDEMAFGALRALSVGGRRAGGNLAAGEVAVIGFDGHDLAEAFELTTIGQPVRNLGRAAADLLMERVLGTRPQVTPHELVLPTELAVRASTGGPGHSGVSAGTPSP